MKGGLWRSQRFSRSTTTLPCCNQSPVDLRKQYGKSYQVVPAPSGAEALEILDQLLLRDSPIALIVSDQRMPGMVGTTFLSHARSVVPTAKLVLLTAYVDTDVAIKSINDLGLHHYLLKPGPPRTACTRSSRIS